MTIDRLRNTLRARPFRPFRLHMGDGKRAAASIDSYVRQKHGLPALTEAGSSFRPQCQA